MKRLISKLALLAPIGAGMLAINAVVDVADLVHTSRSREIARMLEAGRNVAVDVDHVDQRTVQRFYLETRTAPPDWIVLGSSRAMPISSEMAGTRSFFNHAVFSAVLEDYVGIVGLYRARQLQPRHVLLTVDPWMLNGLDDPPYWQSFEDVYDATSKAANISIDHGPFPAARSLTVAKIDELASLQYFQRCLRQAVYGRTFGSVPPAETDASVGDSWKLLADGSVQYPRAKYDVPVDAVRREIDARPSGVKASAAFVAVEPSLRQSFDRFLVFLRAENVDVTLAFLPFHPAEYQRMRDRPGYSIATTVERDVRGLAARTGLKVLGSYDPAPSGCNESEFFDGVHPKPSCLSKVLSASLE